MQQLLTKYALVKTFYETGKDYIDAFVPFILFIIPKDTQKIDKGTLSEKFNKEFSLVIPEHTINTFITRATRKGFTEQRQKSIFLTEKGIEYIQKIQIRETERKINSLLEDIKKFLSENFRYNLEHEEILMILSTFLKKHTMVLIEFFNPKETTEFDESLMDKNEYYLSRYLKYAENQNPQLYNILKGIFYGALIQSLLLKQNLLEINKKFSSLQIFLDSNFIFSIMDLHYPYICKPAKELFELLKEYKFQIKVFDFTIDEMVRVLNGYKKEEYKYYPHIKVDSIYSNLKNKGWTSDDCLRFISQIEEKIWKKEIQIELTNIEVKNFTIDDNSYSRLSQYKPDQHPLGAKHDIAAINKIKDIRKSSKREIENCTAIFLTSDLKLAKFNFIELGHKDNLTVCEIISDRLMTNLLWLKNPTLKEDIPLTVFLSLHSEILIDRIVWVRFYENLKKLKEEGKINGSDISTLLYHHQIEDILLKSDPETIRSDFILDEIRKSKQERTEEMEKLKKQICSLKEKLNQEELEKQQKIEKERQMIKDKIKKVAERRSVIWSNLIIIGIPILLCLIGIILIIATGVSIETFFFWIGAISTVVGILSFLGIQLDIKGIKQKVKSKIFNKIYRTRLKEIDLEETRK